MHEGELLRQYLHSRTEALGDIAKMLGMTRQNLNHHLRKEAMGHDFKRLIKDKLGTVIIENRFVTYENTRSIVSEPTQPKYNEAIPIDMSKWNVQMIPLVGKYAHAGYLSGYGDEEYMATMPRIPIHSTRERRGHYLAFEVKGDSMDDGTAASILDGDVVVAREVGRQHWDSKLHIDKYDFVIHHRTDGIVVKRIIGHDVPMGMLTLHSRNSMYDDYKVSLNDVAQLFNVVQLIRG